MKIKLIIDKVNYQTKPSTDIGAIINRMKIDNVKEYSIEEIKKSVLDGKTIRPSYCGGQETDWISQQVFMIDIDNKPVKPKKMSDNEYEILTEQYLKENHKTYDEIIEHCKKINIIPNFVYTSFNHKENHHKMRLVFVLDKVIIDENTAKKILLYLMESIGEVDEMCKNLNRIFFAGKNIVFDSGNILDSDYIIDLSNSIILEDSKENKVKVKKNKINNNKENKVKDLMVKYPKLYNKDYKIKDIVRGLRVTNIYTYRSYSFNLIVTLSQRFGNPSRAKVLGNPKPSSSIKERYNIKALINREAEYLQTSLNCDPIVFDNKEDFWYHIYYNINMAELLEFKYPSSVKCLFHKDSNPSASIFQTNEGKWLYKCHSGKCGVSMNTKQLIEKLGGFKSEYRAIEFIKTIFNLSIKETQWSIEQKTNLDLIINTMNLNKFMDLCPQTDKNIRYVKELFLVMAGIAQNNIYGENYMNSDGDAVFFVSLGELARITKTAANNLKRISQRLAVLTYHDLIRKLDDDKIPPKMLAKAQAIAIANKTTQRVSFYSIPSWVFDQLNNIESQGVKWKQNGYTVKGTSYEMFYRTEGLEVAQNIYPQYKKVASKDINYETGEIIESVKDRTTTKKSDERVENIVSVVEKLVSEKNYTTEKEIVLYLSKEYKWEVTEIQLRKMRGELEKIGYIRVRANKELKEKYSVQSNGYPMIICKSSESDLVVK